MMNDCGSGVLVEICPDFFLCTSSLYISNGVEVQTLAYFFYGTINQLYYWLTWSQEESYGIDLEFECGLDHELDRLQDDEDKEDD